jgi:hypothetical protein
MAATYEYDVCDGITVQHYGPRDWFPVIDAGWWVREWLMCDETCEGEVESADGDGNRATWGEVRGMLEHLGNIGPYGEEPVFSELTYNHENALSDELLVAAGWVDVSEHALTRGIGSPLLRAVFAHMPEHAWADIGKVWVVAIAYGGAYGRSDSVADVYVSPNMDDDYDVARWNCLLIASGDAGSHPVWDACGGFGDAIDGLEGSGYPYGRFEDRMPMYAVDDMTGDPEDSDMPAVIDHAWLACGGAGVFAVGTDGRVHRVWGGVS